MSDASWPLRPWDESDAPASAALLDLVYANDPIARETQAVHGDACDDLGWFSRTVVAVRNASPDAGGDGETHRWPRPGLTAQGWPRLNPTASQKATAHEDAGPPPGKIVGVGTLFESAAAPARWRLSFQVHPTYRCRGIGAALLTSLASFAAARDPRPLQAGLRADDTTSLRFLSHRGFRPLMRTRLGTIDPEILPALSPRPPIASERLSGSAWAVSPGRQGAPPPHSHILPLPALLHRPTIIPQLATLHAQIHRQTHAWSPPAPLTQSQAETTFLGSGLIPAALFVALIDDTPIGVASLRHGLVPSEIDLGWTGVLAEHASAAPDLTAALLHRCLSHARPRGWTVHIEVDEADQILWRLTDALPVTWEPDWLNLER